MEITGKCLICEKGTLHIKNMDLDYEYEGHKTIINKDVNVCDLCGEIFYQDKDEKEVEERLTNARNEIDKNER